VEAEEVRAFGFKQHGELPDLTMLDLPEPHAGPGQVRIAVEAAGLNHLDLFVLHGIEGIKVPLPHVVAADGSGVVDEVGPGVSTVKTREKVLVDPNLSDGTCDVCKRGQEVMCRNYGIVGEHTSGNAAEYSVLPAVNVVPLPERLDFVNGAAAPLVFLTAWRSLMTVGELKEGETVAIVGAGGGLVTAAIQLSHWRGAKVLVVTRSKEKGERARKLGADEVIVPTPERSMSKALWEASSKRGVDLVYDSVGSATFQESMKVLARGGRLVFVGATTGPKVEVDLRSIFWRNASIRGSTMSTHAEFHAVLKLLSEGKVHPVVDSVYPLEEGGKAMTRLNNGDMFGKIVLKVA
jgi:NADPH:quinone reductase-like Zn-dependent oxidoreductase